MKPPFEIGLETQNPINHHKSNPNQKAIDFLATQLPDLELGYYQELITAIPKAKSYELLNGAQVILKSGKLAPSVYGDEHHLRMHAYAPQGARCFSSTDFHNAVNATQIIKNAGVGRLDKFELKEIKKREGAKISIHSYIRPYESGMYLNTSLKNLELAFQLIYLYFTQPNKDKIAFEDWKDGASYQYLTGINQDDFTNKMKESLEDPYYIPRGSQAITGIKETDFERAYLIYEVLFGDVSKFTFQFSGNFEEQKILNLCRKYLGNLPQNPIKISCPPVPKPPKTKPSIPLQQEFIANEKSEYIRLKLLYLTPLEEGYTDWKNEIKISIVYSLLGNILMKNLRMDSDKGGPYGIGVGNYHVNQPASYQEVAITFGARPEDEERLLTETKEVIDSLKTGSISKKIFQSVVNSLSSKQNNFTNMDVQHKMYNYYKYNAPWISMKKRREYINTLSYEEVVDFAQKILKEPPYIFKLLPQIEQ